MPDVKTSLKLPSYSAAPSSPSEGQVYYDTALQSAYLRTASAWVAMVGSDATKVDKDSVVTAATRLVASKLAGGDTQPAFRIWGDGKHEWGQGGTTAPDASLYRSAAAELTTNASLITTGNLTVSYSLGVDKAGGGGALYFGASQDTILSRSAAFTLSLTAHLRATGELNARYGAAAQVLVGSVGGLAGLTFGSAADTNLYRPSADVLKTDDRLFSATGFAADTNNVLPGFAGIRSASNPLLTNVLASVDTSYAFVMTGNGGMSWGPGGTTATDTNLYRSAAASLQTDGSFYAGLRIIARDPTWGFLYAPAAAGGQTIVSRVAGEANARFSADVSGLLAWGPGGASVQDTNLYRSGVGALKTDGTFEAVGRVLPASLGSGTRDGTKYLRDDGTWQALPAAALTSQQTSLGAPVTITSASTWTDGLSLSLTAGTWLVIAIATIQQASGGGGNMGVRLTDGTTVKAYAESSVSIGASALWGATLAAIYTFGSTTSVKTQGYNTRASGTFPSQGALSPSGQTVNTITAVRIA